MFGCMNVWVYTLDQDNLYYPYYYANAIAFAWDAYVMFAALVNILPVLGLKLMIITCMKSRVSCRLKLFLLDVKNL